jgi:hypothetical protein
MPMVNVDSASRTVPEHAVAGGLFGATMAHTVVVHEAQLHVHGVPETVAKVTASISPAAEPYEVCALRGDMGTGEHR